MRQTFPVSINRTVPAKSHEQNESGLGLPLMKDVTLSSVKYVAGSLKFLGTYGAMNTLQISLPRFLLWFLFCIFFIIWIATSFLNKRRESPSDHQAHIALIFIQKNAAALFLLQGGLCFRAGVSYSNTTEDFCEEAHFTFLNFYGELLTSFCFSFFRSFFSILFLTRVIMSVVRFYPKGSDTNNNLYLSVFCTVHWVWLRFFSNNYL